MSPPPLHAGEREARATRRALGLTETAPIADLLGTVEGTAEVPVFIDRFRADAIAGVLLRRAGDDFVGINADHHPVKQRFTLAHELGHVRLGHQPRIDLAEDLFGPRSNDPQEVEANYFAAELLAPRLAVVAWLEGRDLTASVDAESIAGLAVSFGISLPAACYRAERAGVIGASQKRRLVVQTRDEGSRLVRRVAEQRLRDPLEAVWQADRYPRVPRQTSTYAARALDDGLIDEEAYRSIVKRSGPPDVGAWFE